MRGNDSTYLRTDGTDILANLLYELPDTPDDALLDIHRPFPLDVL